MTLAAAVTSYIRAKRSRGAVYQTIPFLLRGFVRSVGDIPVAEVSSEAVRAFCRDDGPPTRAHANKHSALRNFFQDLVLRGHLSTSPVTDPPPRVTHNFEPHIYSRQEVQRLLDATHILHDRSRPLRPETFRTLLLLLYGTGLRSCEARRLRLCDVDLEERLLWVWDTKFFKSRIVPFGTALRTVLRDYRQTRQDLPTPTGDQSAFLASARGAALSADSVSRTFARVRDHAGIRHSPQARWQPRLHDLRHSFAVERLTSWYRDGKDVQRLLPVLSTYLGHSSIAGTQAYLTMTPELLAEASRRCQRYAEPRGEGDDQCPPST